MVVPVAFAQSVVVIQGSQLNVTLGGSGVGTLSFSVITPPTEGSLSGTAPNLVYTPDPSYFGADVFTFVVVAGALISAPAEINITVTPLPVATPQSLTTIEDEELEVVLSGTGGDGNALTFEVVTQPENGTLTGTAPNLTYTPDAGYDGPDVFTFQATDGTSTSEPAEINITVTPLPVATPQSLTTIEDEELSITLSGTGGDGNALSFEVVTQPEFGTLTGTAPNLTYTPDAGYDGPDSFTFRVSDGTSTSAPATVNVTVTPLPVATPQSLETIEDEALSITLSGTGGDGNALTFEVVTQPTFGTLTGTAPNLTYTPDAEYVGVDSFTFRVSDGTSTSAPATIDIEVTPAPIVWATVDWPVDRVVQVDGIDYNIYKIASSVDFPVTSEGVLLVGGCGSGGGGGYNSTGSTGGGGGAQAGWEEVFVTAGLKPIVIAAPGAGSTSTNVAGGNGSTTTGFGMTFVGGSGGASRNAPPGSGRNGGGGASGSSHTLGGIGTNHSGGDIGGPTNWQGGGGAGEGGDGGDGNTSGGGVGGLGVEVFGVRLGGGGGGGVLSSTLPGGLGTDGGGNGAVATANPDIGTPGSAGANNRGGGGGGGAARSGGSSFHGYNGGSGVMEVARPTI